MAQARDVGLLLNQPASGFQIEGVPEQEVMSFVDARGVMVQQETNLCCRCCCCQPNVNFRMSTWFDDYQPGTDIQTQWYIKEDAGFLGRCMHFQFPGAKKTQWAVHYKNAEGPVLMTHDKPVTCSHCPCVGASDSGELIRCPCCCCLPYLDTRGPDGQLLGTTKYVCDMCLWVPKYDVFDAAGNLIYKIRSDTCCFGCCVQCRRGNRANGGGRRRGCLRVPFYVREPNEPHNRLQGPLGESDITDLWAGWARECCTKQETWGVRFPEIPADSARARKSTLVGATLLLGMLHFEHE